jgi:hypothetical protein
MSWRVLLQALLELYVLRGLHLVPMQLNPSHAALVEKPTFDCRGLSDCDQYTVVIRRIPIRLVGRFVTYLNHIVEILHNNMFCSLTRLSRQPMASFDHGNHT